MAVARVGCEEERRLEELLLGSAEKHWRPGGQGDDVRNGPLTYEESR